MARRPRRKAPSKAPSTRAKNLARKRRALSSNVNYQYWLVGYQEVTAKKTGTMPTTYSVQRDPDFKKAVNTILSSGPRANTSNRGPLAKALVKVGLRDPSFRGKVGNSPKTK